MNIFTIMCYVYHDHFDEYLAWLLWIIIIILQSMSGYTDDIYW